MVQYTVCPGDPPCSSILVDKLVMLRKNWTAFRLLLCFIMPSGLIPPTRVVTYVLCLSVYSVQFFRCDWLMCQREIKAQSTESGLYG